MLKNMEEIVANTVKVLNTQRTTRLENVQFGNTDHLTLSKRLFLVLVRFALRIAHYVFLCFSLLLLFEIIV